jgi:hypothetical protein
LNGNFFKLNHLYAYLNDIRQNLAKNEQHTGSNEQVKIEHSDLTALFERSNKSLFLLNEIYKFLTLPCTYNCFKQASSKHNTFKKYMLFNQNTVYHKSNKLSNSLDLKIDNRFVKLGNQFLNINNNNNENCINLNGTK